MSQLFFPGWVSNISLGKHKIVLVTNNKIAHIAELIPSKVNNECNIVFRDFHGQVFGDCVPVKNEKLSELSEFLPLKIQELQIKHKNIKIYMFNSYNEVLNAMDKNKWV